MADTHNPRYFGITEDFSGVASGIILNDYSETNSVEIAQARSEVGKLLNLACYSESHQATVNGLVAGTGIAVGTIVTLGGKQWIVSQSTKTESNTAFQTAGLTLRRGDADTVLSGLTA